jgi:hypothetical protein
MLKKIIHLITFFNHLYSYLTRLQATLGNCELVFDKNMIFDIAFTFSMSTGNNKIIDLTTYTGKFLMTTVIKYTSVSILKEFNHEG